MFEHSLTAHLIGTIAFCIFAIWFTPIYFTTLLSLGVGIGILDVVSLIILALTYWYVFIEITDYLINYFSPLQSPPAHGLMLKLKTDDDTLYTINTIAEPLSSQSLSPSTPKAPHLPIGHPSPNTHSIIDDTGLDVYTPPHYADALLRMSKWSPDRYHLWHTSYHSQHGQQTRLQYYALTAKAEALQKLNSHEWDHGIFRQWEIDYNSREGRRHRHKYLRSLPGDAHSEKQLLNSPQPVKSGK